jgi:hypothetical protein
MDLKAASGLLEMTVIERFLHNIMIYLIYLWLVCQILYYGYHDFKISYCWFLKWHCYFVWKFNFHDVMEIMSLRFHVASFQSGTTTWFGTSSTDKHYSIINKNQIHSSLFDHNLVQEIRMVDQE